MGKARSSSEGPKSSDGPEAMDVGGIARAQKKHSRAKHGPTRLRSSPHPRWTTARPILISPASLTWIASVGLVAYLVIALRDLWVPFLFAATLTFLGAPWVSRLERRGWPRYFGSFLFLAFVGGLLGALLLLVLPHLISQTSGAVERLPELLGRVQEFLRDVVGIQGRAALDDAFSSAQKELVQSAQDLAAGAAHTISAILSATALVVIVPLLAFFLLAELPSLSRFTTLSLPERWRPVARKYGESIQSALAHMLRGQLIVASILALVYALGLSLVGVPLPFAIGVLAGFAYLIPFASTPVCIGLSALFVLLEPNGPTWWPLAGATFVALLGQVLESWFLTPRIVGKRAQLSPLAVVIAAIVGAELFGFAGVLFALPVGTILGVLFRDKFSGALSSEAEPETAISSN